ncbi:MAG: response regulator [Cyclobacteriaceae bacterium]
MDICIFKKETINVYRAIAIDDDPLALLIVKRFCSRLDKIDLVETYSDSVLGANDITNQKPDIVFLDMEMPDLSGLEILKGLGDSLKVVVVSSNLNIREDALGLNAAAFLHKPTSFPAFERVVEKITHDSNCMSVQSEEVF